MRIEPTGIQPPILRPKTNSPTRSSEEAGEASGTGSSAETFAPTGELAKLLAAVHDQPEVRQDVVDGVSSRMASGELDTPAAAADTAQSMLNAGPFG